MELLKPITVHNVDGTENKQGKLTHYCWLRIVQGERTKLQRFYITSLGQDRIILGYPFLYKFNPNINWRQGKICGKPVLLQSMKYCYVAQRIIQMQGDALRQCGSPKEGEALYVRRTNVAQQWAQKEDKTKVHLTLDTIPKEYRRHAKVFSEEEARRFPPERSEDMTITLTSDAPKELNCKVYPLSRDERDLLKRWILEEEDLGRIYAGPSPYTAPVYFIGKKDSNEKQIIMDYRKLNQYTVRDNNPLPNIQSALERLHGKRLFSKFDIRWGYNNIRIKEEDQYKAAFKTSEGTYIPRVMYFGLTNAPHSSNTPCIVTSAPYYRNTPTTSGTTWTIGGSLPPTEKKASNCTKKLYMPS
jgi:Reverse transcriptase (RNA-dependent DNA polymerase)